MTFRSLFIRKVERDEVNEAEANDPNKPAESSDDGKRLPLRALLTSRVIVRDPQLCPCLPLGYSV